LRPYRGESVHFKTTQTVFAEGDNLEMLRLSQKSHLGKGKMIHKVAIAAGEV
jgi:adenine specific DNA methylase Mod